MSSKPWKEEYKEEENVEEEENWGKRNVTTIFIERVAKEEE